MSEEHSPAPAQRDETEELLEKWFADNFHGSIVARDTETYNHVHQAMQKLKELLRSRR